MKKFFIADIIQKKNKKGKIELFGWVGKIHRLGKIIFIQLVDSTGSIQVVINKISASKQLWKTANALVIETAIYIKGDIKNTSSQKIEIAPHDLRIIGISSIYLSPSPRSKLDISDKRLARLLLDKRHLYIRNSEFIRILKFRHMVTSFIRGWFDKRGFTEITAPILTPVNLYEDKSAMEVKIKNQKVFLTQCVGFYLEAAVHAFEKVYNIGPSFRAEETHSPRHLMEYWHIKSEVAFADLEDIIKLVETLIKDLTLKMKDTRGICLDGQILPYPRITYLEAIQYLKKKGVEAEFGKSLGSSAEVELSKRFKNTPFWIMGMPRKVEPFPYVVDSDDIRITRTADLIASRGFGELLGVAEKISDLKMLKLRMKEKGKLHDPRYKWIEEVHQMGCVPHSAMGMGVERLIRWLLSISHVKDAILFPRLFRRKVYP